MIEKTSALHVHQVSFFFAQTFIDGFDVLVSDFLDIVTGTALVVF